MSRQQYVRLQKHAPELLLPDWKDLVPNFRQRISHLKVSLFVAKRTADLLACADVRETEVNQMSNSDMPF